MITIDRVDDVFPYVNIEDALGQTEYERENSNDGLKDGRTVAITGSIITFPSKSLMLGNVCHLVSCLS